MNNTMQLQLIWTERLSHEESPWSWFSRQIDEARERIEDHSEDLTHPHWLSTNGYKAVFGEPDLEDDEGYKLSPSDARKMAFELLILADLAENNAEATEVTAVDS